MTNELTKAHTASTPSLQARADHREWIGGRAVTLLSHYWREDDPVELTAAIGADWADVLEGLPRDVIQQACIAYQRSEPRRKPTPGAIYAMALARMPKPKPVETARPETREERQAYIDSVAGDKVNPKRKAEAELIISEAGLAKRIGGSDEL